MNTLIFACLFASICLAFTSANPLAMPEEGQPLPLLEIDDLQPAESRHYGGGGHYGGGHYGHGDGGHYGHGGGGHYGGGHYGHGGGYHGGHYGYGGGHHGGYWR